MPWHSPTGAVYPPADFVRNLEIGLEAIDWSGFPGRRIASEARGRLRGIGVSVYVENAGGAPSEFFARDPAVPANMRYFDGKAPPPVRSGTPWPSAHFQRYSIAITPVRPRSSSALRARSRSSG